MNFEEYQKKSRKTAVYPEIGKNFVYPALGLSGEAGEVSEKIKKLFRDKNGIIDDEFIDSLEKELGDVLWYVSQLATEFNLSLDDVAENNIKKLYDRMDRGKLQGSGDCR